MRISWDAVDYTDYGDAAEYGHDTPADSCTNEHVLQRESDGRAGTLPTSAGKDGTALPGERDQLEPAEISAITVINRNQRNQSHVSEGLSHNEEAPPGEGDRAASVGRGDPPFKKERCPHHPRARLVRLDPAGQAWCDHLDCWCCYRLMKIGGALGYRSLKERGGKLLIEEGIAAWATYVRTQRAFLVTSATQEALALCRTLGIKEPDLSDEVTRLVQAQVFPP